MTRSNRWFATTFLFLLSSYLIFASGARGQTQAAPDTMCVPLCFSAAPQTQFLKQGESVVFVLSIYTRSSEPIFVSRLTSDEFVDLSVTGPDGREVPWRGNGRIATREYSPADFAVLGKYQEISAKRIISFKDSAGFVFDKPGQYSVTAEYSLGPVEYFALFAGETKIPTGTFRSTKAAFCIEACVLESLQVHRNGSQAPLDAVRIFYANVTKYKPIGIPNGRARKALWPLLSKRLVQELDSLQACDDDYYRRYGALLEANQYKPATPWLEEGLFSGPDEAAGPIKFSILDSRSVGDNRVDVHLRFTCKQTYCCGQSASYDHWEGVVTVVLESKRWVIDDFVTMHGNDELHRLSDGYRQCRSGQWLGETPY